ncbi:MAG: DUF2203 family protein [Acidobacteria bacterium]|nr:MAG: DUF2203 family protein [Acidobacteriota bacterium]RPJ63604.1 MAG: DUF2203 family protein [Acidobacteriota bacterium]RPJ86191.1 MAG: DUF2203 family protein [Acidobacteriota bacterium]
MTKRFFTVEEARQILPRVRELMQRTVAMVGALEEAKQHVKDLAEKGEMNTGSSVGTRYIEGLAQISECVAAIQETGCIVKSIDEGLVDFPHLREGREVYLCWKNGEPDIGYWHEVDAGFAGRTPLDQDAS